MKRYILILSALIMAIAVQAQRMPLADSTIVTKHSVTANG